MLVSSNPFSTRWVRPGTIPYLFPDGETAAQTVDRLRKSGWWGQVVGPHGSGKSTLLTALLPELRAAGREPILTTLHDGQRVLPPETRALLARRPDQESAIVIIDGYEQLDRWGRFHLRRHCRRRGFGLLVTAHASVGLPDVFRTIVTPESAWTIVAGLTARAAPLIAPSDVSARLAAQDGNLREALFDLYDLHEARRRAEATGAAFPCASIRST